MWSPWRAQHVDSFDRRHRPSGASGSVFSRIAADPAGDEDHFVFWRGQHVFALLNLVPYNNGHALIVPFREVETYDALTPDEQAETALAIGKVMAWLNAALRPEGFNVGINQGAAAGAGIPEHLHVHVVPRWSGDTNFMPVTGEVKVLPEALEATYRKLRAAVEAGDGPA
jgi:ATP adenylyltransferase